ncbi:AEC family transporter [Deinococcus taeanensis]|uniref:AEC family transporter n=1 Tax=Deinococcus taeanensis TaxID=2737050 RepID=UPI001CDCD5D4|nr:AEC family transporter [Deinococcus taeanensis]UBV42354.1 AEC family transporter [Deinococcus taeanensis]
MIQALSNVLLPVMLVAGLGAVLAARFPIDQATMARVTLYLLSPALVLNVLLTTPVQLGEVLSMGSAYALTVAGCLGLGWLTGLGRPQAERRSLTASVGIWNSGNMGLPIALFAFGQAGFARATLLFLMSFVGMYVIAPFVYSAGLRGPAHAQVGAGPGTLVLNVLRLPAVWMVVLGVTLRALHVTLPEGLSRGVELLAQATLPVVLLSLGLQLGAGGWPRLDARVWLATAARLIGGPLLGLGAGLLCGLRGDTLGVLVLSASMPTAVNALLIAREYGGDTDTVARTAFLSTLCSVLTIAAVVAALPRLA